MRERRAQDPSAKKSGDRSRQYRIVLADDHETFREWLKRNLADCAGLEVVGEAADGRALLGLLNAGTLRPDMVIIDISMPNLGGLDASREIKQSHPATKILVLTAHNEKEYLVRAFDAGADGYLLKENAVDLSAAIKIIRKGGVYPSRMADAGARDVPPAEDGRLSP